MPSKEAEGSGEPVEDSPAPNGLRIWQCLDRVPKEAQRSFDNGKFKGTDINTTFRLKRMTDVFGPIGLGWGYTIAEEQFRDGAPKLVNNVPVGYEVLHCIRLRLWYIDPETKERGEVEHFGQTLFVRWVVNKSAFSTDEDAPKKSLTDALGKCLSMLGFAAEIYSGQWNDSKYESFSTSPALTAVPDSRPSQKASSRQAARSTSAPALATISAERFGWAGLKEMTGFSKAKLIELAEFRQFPTSPKDMNDDQLAALRLDLLLEWGRLKGKPIDEIARRVEKTHHAMSDDDLFELIKAFGESSDGGSDRPARAAVQPKRAAR